MATNAAMVLAKPAGKPPRAIAEDLAARLVEDARIETAEVAGPGFLNLRLDPAVWHDVVAEAIDAGKAFGHSGLGAGVKALLDNRPQVAMDHFRRAASRELRGSDEYDLAKWHQRRIAG